MRRQQNSQSFWRSRAAGSVDSREDWVLDDLDSTNLNNSISAKSQPPAVQSPAPKADVCPPSDSWIQSAVPGTPDIVPDNADPSQLQSYPPAVRDIIECAKQFSHCDIASVNLFPLRPDFNHKAVEYINEAIAERRSRGLPIPDGNYFNTSKGDN